jgi:hypothetical protein
LISSHDLLGFTVFNLVALITGPFNLSFVNDSFIVLQRICSHFISGSSCIELLNYSMCYVSIGNRVYPTFCVLQALIYYMLCFLQKYHQSTVGKLLKNMWIKCTNAVAIRGINKD